MDRKKYRSAGGTQLIASVAFAVAAGATFPLSADTWNDGTSVSSSATVFAINTKDDATYGYVTDDVASFPVTWRAGETVTATDRSGNEDTETGYPSSAAGSAGSVAFPSSAAGGVWTLVNSKSGAAYIVVPWTAGEIGTTLAGSAALEDLGIDTVQTTGNGTGGIDRKGKMSALPGYVAYSVDGWLGASTDSCTLKFTAPDATVSTIEKTGTGVESFTFDQAGVWTVELVVGGTTVRSAQVNAMSAGMMIFFK